MVYKLEFQESQTEHLHEEEEVDLFHMVQNRSSRVKAPGGIFQLILKKNVLALGITSQWKGMTYCGVSFLV